MSKKLLGILNLEQMVAYPNYIGKSNVTESQYDAFLEKMWAHARENEAVWHDFTDANITSVFK